MDNVMAVESTEEHVSFALQGILRHLGKFNALCHLFAKNGHGNTDVQGRQYCSLSVTGLMRIWHSGRISDISFL